MIVLLMCYTKWMKRLRGRVRIIAGLAAACVVLTIPAGCAHKIAERQAQTTSSRSPLLRSEPRGLFVTGFSSEQPRRENATSISNPSPTAPPVVTARIPPQQQHLSPANERLDQARRAYEDGDFGTATELVRQARLIDPSLTACWRLEAQIALDRGDRTAYTTALQRICSANPRSATIQNELGNQLFHAGEHVAGLLALRQATLLAPRQTRYSLDLAAALAESGDFPQARATLRDAIERDSTNAELVAAFSLLSNDVSGDEIRQAEFQPHDSDAAPPSPRHATPIIRPRERFQPSAFVATGAAALNPVASPAQVESTPDVPDGGAVSNPRNDVHDNFRNRLESPSAAEDSHWPASTSRSAAGLTPTEDSHFLKRVPSSDAETSAAPLSSIRNQSADWNAFR